MIFGGSLNRGFCKKYRPQPKPEKRQRWGSKLLAGMKPKRQGKKSSPGQLKLFWDELNIDNEEIQQVASKFVKANCYNPNPNLSPNRIPRM
ncbi:hypothetical protein CUN59_14515 [Cuspidothrix issatschenkoi CHARLIE-1]|jgi:putative transposase|uniref:Uncharacterized protein n=1 Tax=Cuspidothrix issatschenkoi CHARLIE-1 TaxID=2052836 RepID=A0A2S6CSE0_9CYAN|nr:hypothetical protein CUN59_14515 [Cuspidothrix issatschenkoi CHARLIE-1]